MTPPISKTKTLKPTQKKRYDSYLSTITLSNQRSEKSQLDLYDKYVEFLKTKLGNKIKDIYCILERGKNGLSPHIHCIIILNNKIVKSSAKKTYLWNWLYHNVDSSEYSEDQFQEYNYHTNRLNKTFKIAHNVGTLIEFYLSKEEDYKLLYTSLSSDKLEEFSKIADDWKKDKENQHQQREKHKTLNQYQVKQMLMTEIEKLLYEPVLEETQQELDEKNPTQIYKRKHDIQFSKHIFCTALTELREYEMTTTLKNVKLLYKSMYFKYTLTKQSAYDYLMEELDNPFM